MKHIKLPKQLISILPEEKRKVITSDETWAFTERPKIETQDSNRSRIGAHDLFDLFTAGIIKKNTLFTR